MKYYKEILVTEAIIFSIFWASNEYLATLLTFIAVPVFGAILIISMIAEKIESSKIGKNYFIMMAGLTIIPALIFGIMTIANGGTSFEWGK
ncbi:MAG: hypothetical protein RIR48_1287 [Bacteroidota bacterium]|jgi:hypothetical protein